MYPNQVPYAYMSAPPQAQRVGYRLAPRQRRVNQFTGEPEFMEDSHDAVLQQIILSSGSQQVITPEQSLSTDFGKLYKNEKFADVTLVLNDKSYKAHKIVLAARSSFFASTFESQTDNVVNITDMKTEVLEEVLRYIYTGKAEKLDHLAKDLIVAADKYGLEGLKRQCEKFLLQTISVSNAFDLYKFANEKGADELKRDVLKFIVSRFRQVMNTEDWKSLNSDGMNFIMLKELCEAFHTRQSPSSGYSNHLNSLLDQLS